MEPAVIVLRYELKAVRALQASSEKRVRAAARQREKALLLLLELMETCGRKTPVSSEQ